MIEIGSRARTQPPPAWVVFEALTEPDRDPTRPWLFLLGDEERPQIVEAVPSTRVVWSSIWVKRPDAVIHFDLVGESPDSQLRWTLFVDDPAPDSATVRHLRKRLNELINRDLRHTFGN